MKEHAYRAPTKANGIAILRGLAASHKFYDSAPDHKGMAHRRAKAKAARKARKTNR